MTDIASGDEKEHGTQEVSTGISQQSPLVEQHDVSEEHTQATGHQAEPPRKPTRVTGEHTETTLIKRGQNDTNTTPANKPSRPQTRSVSSSYPSEGMPSPDLLASPPTTLRRKVSSRIANAQKRLSQSFHQSPDESHQQPPLEPEPKILVQHQFGTTTTERPVNDAVVVAGPGNLQRGMGHSAAAWAGREEPKRSYGEATDGDLTGSGLPRLPNVLTTSSLKKLAEEMDRTWKRLNESGSESNQTAGKSEHRQSQSQSESPSQLEAEPIGSRPRTEQTRTDNSDARVSIAFNPRQSENLHGGTEETTIPGAPELGSASADAGSNQAASTNLSNSNLRVKLQKSRVGSICLKAKDNLRRSGKGSEEGQKEQGQSSTGVAETATNNGPRDEEEHSETSGRWERLRTRAKAGRENAQTRVRTVSGNVQKGVRHVSGAVVGGAREAFGAVQDTVKKVRGHGYSA